MIRQGPALKTTTDDREGFVCRRSATNGGREARMAQSRVPTVQCTDTLPGLVFHATSTSKLLLPSYGVYRLYGGRDSNASTSRVICPGALPLSYLRKRYAPAMSLTHASLSCTLQRRAIAAM